MTNLVRPETVPPGRGKGEKEMTFQEAITAIEKNTCFRLTAVAGEESAFFVPVAQDGKTVIGDCIELTRAKIMKLAQLKKP